MTDTRIDLSPAANPPVLAVVTALLRRVVRQPDLVVTAQTTQADVDGLDSFAMLEFLFSVEQHFGLKFRSMQMDQFVTVGDIVAAVQAGRNGDPGSPAAG